MNKSGVPYRDNSLFQWETNEVGTVLLNLHSLGSKLEKFTYPGSQYNDAWEKREQ